MMENNKPSIKKVPLKEFIDRLVDLYEEGIDFIDINGSEHSATKDILNIGVCPSYYRKEVSSSDKTETAILTEDDLNNLI